MVSSYNHSYIILIGVSNNKAYYLIVKGDITYNHRVRKYFISTNGTKTISSNEPKN